MNRTLQLRQSTYQVQNTCRWDCRRHGSNFNLRKVGLIRSSSRLGMLHLLVVCLDGSFGAEEYEGRVLGRLHSHSASQ